MCNNIKVRRGDIWEAELPCTEGDIITKTRPVIIITNWLANDNNSFVTVIPITSANKAELPCHVIVSEESNLPRKSVALIEQVMTIDKSRFKKRKGYVPEWNLLEIGNAMSLHFGYFPSFSEEQIERVKLFIETLNELDSYLKYKQDQDILERYTLYSKYLKDYCKKNNLPVNWQKYEVKEHGYIKKYA